MLYYQNEFNYVYGEQNFINQLQVINFIIL